MSNQPAEFTEVHVPARIAEISFTLQMPSDWRRVDLPDEQPNFDKPDYFLPLFVCMATYGVVVLSVAARPAYGDGTVRQWVQFVASEQGVQIEQLRAVKVGGSQALMADAVQQSEAGLMRVRAIFLEDGGRFINICAMAPAQIWNSVEWQFEAMLGSFKLDQPRGPKAALDAVSENAAEPTNAPAGIPADGDVVQAALQGIVTEDPRRVANDANPTTEPDRAAEPTMPADIALADDAASLDPENPMNARMRDNGVGLVPRVIHVDENFKYAVLGAAAIESTFKLPLGWHCMDDGKRTLVFDAGGKIQVNLNLRPTEGRSHEQMLEAILKQYRAEHPNLEHLSLEMGGMKTLCLRNMVIDGESLEQAFLIRETHRGDMALVCRVTGKTDDMPRAMNLAEVILTSIQQTLDDRPRSDAGSESPELPGWWKQAVALQEAGQMDAAEKSVLAAVDHLGAFASVAELWKRRMQQLIKAGDRPGARAAFDRASNWISQYAASATSGGEGAALSLARQEFMGELEREYEAQPSLR